MVESVVSVLRTRRWWTGLRRQREAVPKLSRSPTAIQLRKSGLGLLCSYEERQRNNRPLSCKDEI